MINSPKPEGQKKKKKKFHNLRVVVYGVVRGWSSLNLGTPWNLGTFPASFFDIDLWISWKSAIGLPVNANPYYPMVIQRESTYKAHGVHRWGL